MKNDETALLPWKLLAFNNETFLLFIPNSDTCTPGALGAALPRSLQIYLQNSSEINSATNEILEKFPIDKFACDAGMPLITTEKHCTSASRPFQFNPSVNKLSQRDLFLH